MAAITELTRSDLERLLHDYDVGPLVGFKSASEGIENTNYFVRTAGKAEALDNATEFVLTLIESEDPLERDRELMIRVLDTCFEQGLPVAPVVRTRNGATATNMFSKPVYLSPRLQGIHTAVPVLDQCEAVGRFLARMHLVVESLECQEYPYVRDSGWLQQSQELVYRHLGFTERTILNDAVRQVVSMLARNDVTELPQGVIHGDLFRDNVLFNRYGLNGVVDFHHASRGYWIYDVAVAMNDWCRNGESLDNERSLAFMREYNAIRPFAPGELWFLPIFLLYGAVAFWMSRLLVAVRDDLPPSHPVKDPSEFAEVVACHLRTPFRVDPHLFD